MAQIIAKVTMKVPHRVRSNTSERFAGTSSRVASSERLKPKTRSLKASRRWVKRSPYIGGAGRVSGLDLLLERSGTIPEEYHGEAAILMPTMKAICKACGTQFPEASRPPSACPICCDARQFVPKSGQEWTTLEKLRGDHRNAFRQYEANLIGIGTVPEFAIGQLALLIRTPDGNFLWDCIMLVDDATVEMISAMGGLRGIAISHPHYYSAMLEWSAAFENAPIFLHAADREWVMQAGKAIEFWDGARKELAAGLTLSHCGGHFAGGTV